MNTMPSIQEMQGAYLSKDSTYDGIFFWECERQESSAAHHAPARRPLPENVTYFSSTREAMFAGFRPCKRCRPLETDGRPPEWIARALNLVNASEERVRDSELRRSGIDPFRFVRYFQKNYGMTFQAYCRARRLGEALLISCGVVRVWTILRSQRIRIAQRIPRCVHADLRTFTGCEPRSGSHPCHLV
jgi:AraC family transcriptional regulator of adaptative response/methylated-DNA-[protein]-cysteine methyltransferase